MSRGQGACSGGNSNYFVDEAGDGTLFSSRGRVLVGASGCSRCFILGLAEIAEPAQLRTALAGLRAELLGDDYFAGIPSLQPERGKTALAFHATDDVPEVRERVFRLLLRHDIRFFAVVRDKRSLLDYVRQRNERDPDYRYRPDELYEYLVRRLFRDRLHQRESYEVCFARRGRSDRTDALMSALAAARMRFAARHGIERDVLLTVIPRWSREDGCLQAVDYLLWALQRLYEKREERYLRYIWPLVSLVHDLDDTRCRQYGEYYTSERPLTLAALKQEPEI